MKSKKNDVSAFLGAVRKQPDKVLQAELVSLTKPAQSEKQKATGKKQKSVVGRPPVAEKRTVKITLSLTEKEGRVLKQNAGLTPLASLLLAKLHETDVFQE